MSIIRIEIPRINKRGGKPYTRTEAYSITQEPFVNEIIQLYDSLNLELSEKYHVTPKPSRLTGKALTELSMKARIYGSKTWQRVMDYCFSNKATAITFEYNPEFTRGRY